MELHELPEYLRAKLVEVDECWELRKPYHGALVYVDGARYSPRQAVRLALGGDVRPSKRLIVTCGNPRCMRHCAYKANTVRARLREQTKQRCRLEVSHAHELRLLVRSLVARGYERAKHPSRTRMVVGTYRVVAAPPLSRWTHAERMRSGPWVLYWCEPRTGWAKPGRRAVQRMEAA